MKRLIYQFFWLKEAKRMTKLSRVIEKLSLKRAFLYCNKDPQRNR